MPAFDANQIELSKLRLEIWKVHVDRWKAMVVVVGESGKSTVEFSKVALSQAVLVNGGAAVAVLALAGNLHGRQVPGGGALLSSLATSLVAFAAGVLLAAAAGCLSYLAQVNASVLRETASRRWRRGAIAALIASLLSFVAGVGLASRALMAAP